MSENNVEWSGGFSQYGGQDPSGVTGLESKIVKNEPGNQEYYGSAYQGFSMPQSGFPDGNGYNTQVDGVNGSGYSNPEQSSYQSLQSVGYSSYPMDEYSYMYDTYDNKTAADFLASSYFNQQSGENRHNHEQFVKQEAYAGQSYKDNSQVSAVKRELEDGSSQGAPKRFAQTWGNETYFSDGSANSYSQDSTGSFPENSGKNPQGSTTGNYPPNSVANHDHMVNNYQQNAVSNFQHSSQGSYANFPNGYPQSSGSSYQHSPNGFQGSNSTNFGNTGNENFSQLSNSYSQNSGNFQEQGNFSQNQNGNFQDYAYSQDTGQQAWPQYQNNEQWNSQATGNGQMPYPTQDTPSPKPTKSKKKKAVIIDPNADKIRQENLMIEKYVRTSEIAGTIAETFLQIETELNKVLNKMKFCEPVTHIYNPTIYAREPHEAYIRRFITSRKEILFLGMNPGPFGMAQNGIPFGEVNMVKDWLKIDGKVDKPVNEHPQRPVLGFECTRSEVSGARFWGLFRRICGTPEDFFRHCLVHNYCPLALMSKTGKNITPPQLAKTHAGVLNDACDQALCDIVKLLGIKVIIGIGKFAQDRAKAAFKNFEPGLKLEIQTLLHPSPINPWANKGWEPVAERQLREMGVYQIIATDNPNMVETGSSSPATGPSESTPPGNEPDSQFRAETEDSETSLLESHLLGSHVADVMPATGIPKSHLPDTPVMSPVIDQGSVNSQSPASDT